MTPEPTLTFTHEGKPYGVWAYETYYGDGRMDRCYEVAPIGAELEGYEILDLRHRASVRRAAAAEALAEAALYEAAADAVDALTTEGP